MSATDELRSMLTMRGVEHTDLYTALGRDQITQWPTKDLLQATATEHEQDGTLLVTFYGSAEQAVEATLGKRECRNLIARIQGQMPMLHCEECGCTTTLNVPSGGAGYIGETAMDWPLYCANCGRKVRA